MQPVTPLLQPDLTTQQNPKPSTTRYFWIAFTIVMVVIILLIPLLLFIKFTQPKTAQEKTQVLTIKLVQLKDQYNKASGKEKEEKLQQMLVTAQARKELLLQKIKENPQEFLDKASLTDQIDLFPEPIKPYIEERIQTQGKLTIIHGDDFENKKAIYEYFLDIDKFELYFATNPPQFNSGSEVKIVGIELDKNIVLSSGELSNVLQPQLQKINETTQSAVQGVSTSNQITSLQLMSTPSELPTIGEQKTLVLMVYSGNSPQPPFTIPPKTADQNRDMIFSNTNPKSVNNYYKETSYGKTFLSGDVFGWYSIAPTSCNKENLGSLAQDKARAAGVNVNNYHRIVYILGGNLLNCYPNYAGFATAGGNPTESWIIVNGEVIQAHEFGHQLGANHASSIVCQLGSITSNTCLPESEYGDFHDVMGTSYEPFNGPHKVGMGWVPESNIKIATASANFTISPLETMTTTTQVLTIPKPDTDSFYFISYRRPELGTFFDNSFDISQGVSIHTWKPNSFQKTIFIERQGPFISYGISTLLDNEIFMDQINGFQVKQTGHNANGATIEVTIDNVIDLVVSGAPSLNSGNLSESQNVTFKAIIKNISIGEIATNFKNSFEIDTNSSSFTAVDVNLGNPQVNSLAPGESVDVVSDAWNNIPSGIHTLRVCANRPKLVAERDDSDVNNCKLFTFTVVAKIEARIFATSTKYTGDLKTAGSNIELGSANNGLDGADKICQSRANAANLGGLWRAWLSDSVINAASRLTHRNVKYGLIDNTPIADNWNDLIDSKLTSSIHRTENGDVIAESNNWDVWTATYSFGEAYHNFDDSNANCNNWTSNSSNYSSYGGSTRRSDSEWSISYLGGRPQTCNNLRRLYCFEEPPPTNLNLDINLQFIGSPGNPNPATPQRQVNVKVFNSSNQKVAEKTGNVTYDTTGKTFKGSLTLDSALTSGTYSILVKTDGFLSKLIPSVSITQATVQLPLTTLNSGDINLDDQVNIADFDRFVKCFGKRPAAVTATGQPCTTSDLNDDNGVDIVDWSAFVNNFGRRGDSFSVLGASAKRDHQGQVLAAASTPINGGMSLFLKLPGIGTGQGENFTPARLIRQATVYALSTASNQLKTLNADLEYDSQDGRYEGVVEFKDLASGNYKFYVKLDNTLNKLFKTLDIQTGQIYFDTTTITLPAGDLNFDNIINSQDENILADLNDDGAVNQVDLSILRLNIGQRSGFIPSPTPSPSPTPATKNPPCSGLGDVNLDGVISQDDIAWIREQVAGTRNFTDEQSRKADVNGDNNITNIDSLKVSAYLQGIVATFDICLPITISNISAKNITSSGALIIWTTSVPGKTQVSYGLNRNNLTATTLDPSYTPNHSVNLTGLQRGKLYFYKVKSINGAGEIESPLRIFKTRP